MAPIAIAGIFIVAIAGGVGFGVASADSSDDLARAGAFGFDEATHIATLTTVAEESDEARAQADTGTSGQRLLSTPSARDISAGLVMVDQRAAADKDRAAGNSAAATERADAGKARQDAASTAKASAFTSAASTSSGTAQAATSAARGANTAVKLMKTASAAASAPVVVYDPNDPETKPPTVEPLEEYDLPVVDWSVGKKAFLAEWGGRINAYLDGTPLQGYGDVFAQAAWDNGVDPRWSPAISNTESGNGTHCFLPYNAWGWGNDSWSDWESAIRAHVAGLADVYGYSLTFDAAQKYCPPNCYHWYNNTLGQMRLI